MLPDPTGIARRVPTQLLHRSPIPTARSTRTRARIRDSPAAAHPGVRVHGQPCVSRSPKRGAWTCARRRVVANWNARVLKDSRIENEVEPYFGRFTTRGFISSRSGHSPAGPEGLKLMTTRASTRRGGGSAGGGVGVGAGAAVGAGVGSAAAVSTGGGGRGGHSSEGPPEHLSPGYGAGYDAGFQAGLIAALRGVAPPPGPPPGEVAAEGGACASAPEPSRPPFLALLEDFPDLLQKEVLERLDPLDLTMLGHTRSAVRTAVKRSGLPRVGGSPGQPRVGPARVCQSLSTFVWAVAIGCRWQFSDTCEDLAGGGHLEVLRWAREHGCSLDEYTCARAAAGGHLEVLRWAREHGAPWHEVLEDAPGARLWPRVCMSSHPTDNDAPVPTAAPAGAPLQRRMHMCVPTGSRAPGPTATPPGAHPAQCGCTSAPLTGTCSPSPKPTSPRTRYTVSA